ncbi:MAG: heterodisulfide reductase-related iron-sulfur binding cluster [Gemmatimonadetes bacterium]|nr:heterodisulfide reductase-related iron-sulfur binding cluster [Gemmatimonadota bacterium]
MTKALSDALETQRERLLPCVHCGFCLPACPTYTRLGDENDSPRGRLHLMRSVVEGRMSPASDAFRTHIDRCLGCRACEPVCPSGVEYGTLLELARETVAEHHPPGLLTRTLLAVMAQPTVRGAFMWKSRVIRGSGLAGVMARMMPNVGPFRGAKLGLAMLAASAPWRPPRATRADRSVGSLASRVPPSAKRGRVGVLAGCVQQGLFARVNDATVRVLEANGYEVVTVPRQDCCGALHAHGGHLDRAKRLAQANIDAFDGVELDWIAVNAAGCGAAMKEYGTLLENDPAWLGRASSFAARVRDVTELLADVGPKIGAEVQCTIAYDHPCHLLHAQKVERAPLAVLAAVPGAEVRVVERADECCGGAGIYGITHPDLGGQIGRDKVAAVRACGADAVATANPGCMMQIGAGLYIEGAPEGVLHPVELLDVSYRRAGFYH